MGDDVILGGSNTDVIVGNGGNDWIGGGAGNDILAAGSGAIASSGSDPDNIFGNVGSTYESTIVGGDGNDTLVAIEGNVIATGGEGSDTFAFYGAQVGLKTHLTITSSLTNGVNGISKCYKSITFSAIITCISSTALLACIMTLVAHRL
jgi:hypothetical protein